LALLRRQCERAGQLDTVADVIKVAGGKCFLEPDRIFGAGGRF
jgi:hypothetical protein